MQGRGAQTRSEEALIREGVHRALSEVGSQGCWGVAAREGRNREAENCREQVPPGYTCLPHRVEALMIPSADEETGCALTLCSDSLWHLRQAVSDATGWPSNMNGTLSQGSRKRSGVMGERARPSMKGVCYGYNSVAKQ